MIKCPACEGKGEVPDIALTKEGWVRIIDTDPDIGKHTALCSCHFCLEIKKTIFKGVSKSTKDAIKTGNLLLYRVLVSDGIF